MVSLTCILLTLMHLLLLLRYHLADLHIFNLWLIKLFHFMWALLGWSLFLQDHIGRINRLCRLQFADRLRCQQMHIIHFFLLITLYCFSVLSFRLSIFHSSFVWCLSKYQLGSFGQHEYGFSNNLWKSLQIYILFIVKLNKIDC